jgi:hypothetical protein
MRSLRLIGFFMRASVQEEAAYRAAMSWETPWDEFPKVDVKENLLHESRIRSDTWMRFLQQFPRSEHYEYALVHASMNSITAHKFDDTCPAGLSQKEYRRIIEFYLQR